MKMILLCILIVLIINLFFVIKTKDKEVYKKIEPYIFPKEKSIPVILCLALWLREYYIFGMLLNDELVIYTFATAAIYLINLKKIKLNLFFSFNVTIFFSFFFLEISYSIIWYFLITLLLFILDFREQKKSEIKNKIVPICCTFSLIAFVIYKIIFGYGYYY